MDEEAVFEYLRDGVWATSFSSHYNHTRHCLNKYKKTIKRIAKREDELRKDSSIEAEFLELYVTESTRKLHEEAYFYGTSVKIYACMTIEGFVNYYGTKRLGETFYKSNIERIGITEKISILLLLLFNTSLKKDNPKLKLIRNLFDARNALVHPKTKELDIKNIENYLYKHPKDLNIETTYNSLEDLINYLCSLDKDISREIYFKK